LAVLVALGVVYALAVHSVAARKSELASLTRQVAVVSAEGQALQQYVQVALVSAEKVHEVAALAEQRFNWPTAMAQLALALPNDVAFTSFTATVGGSPNTPSAATTPTSPTAGSATGFALVGCANGQGEIPAVLTNLASVPGVTNVHLVSTVEPAALRYHALTTKLNGGGPPAVSLPASATCPKVTFTLDLSYAATYTVPNTKAPKGSTGGAQTVSTSSGTSTPIAKTASRAAGVTR
jgi:hypothetical protein